MNKHNYDKSYINNRRCINREIIQIVHDHDEISSVQNLEQSEVAYNQRNGAIELILVERPKRAAVSE